MQAYLPEISLIALAVAVVVGIVRNVNVGPLSMAIALVIGYYIGGVKIRDLIAGYPVNVFSCWPASRICLPLRTSTARW